jgi:hypothetical protein
MSYAELVCGPTDGPSLEALMPDRTVWDLFRFEFGRAAKRQIDLLLDVSRSWRPSVSAHREITLWRTVLPPAPDPPSAVPRLPGITIFLASWWREPDADEAEVRWLRETAERFTSSGLVSEAASAMNHVSFPTEARIRALYGPEAYERLARIKAIYDPDNIFQSSYAIPPRLP